MLLIQYLTLAFIHSHSDAHFGRDNGHFAVHIPRHSVPKKYSNSDDLILKLRGGAGNLDPSIFIKTSSIIAGLQGLALQFAPVDTLISSGHEEVQSKEPINEVLAAYAGTYILTWAAATAYLSFSNEATAKGAFIVAAHIWIYEHLRNILGKTVEKAGGDSKGIKIAAISALVGLYSVILVESDIVMKVIGTFWALYGLHMIVDPAGACRIWDSFETIDKIGKGSMETLGFGILAQSLIIIGVSFLNYNTIQSIGLGSTSWLIYHLYRILSRRDEMPIRGLRLFWIVLNSLIIYTSLSN